MKRLLWLLLALLLTAAPLAAAGKILLVAHDLEDHPLPGLQFTYAGFESRATNAAGSTELDLPAGYEAGRQIKILLLASKKAEDWFLVNPQVNIPDPSNPADVVLMRRRAFRQVAAEARDAPKAASQGASGLSAEDQKRALVEAAKRHGLTAEQLETALASFAETQDPKDRGIADYLRGQYSEAEKLLQGAAEKKTLDLVETLRYLGASQFEQAKYQAAVDSFRKALALREGDARLLDWLGKSHYSLARWAEAEPLMRRALAIDEKSLGPDHPNVAIRLNNLVQLLQATNRLPEAEPLMRRALAIEEKSFGPHHPYVAICLSNLAQLLQDTNRLPEAEPLMRRALAIAEKSLGPDHPGVAIDLNNLAALLQATNRLAEAEPLMRRALAIDEKSFGLDHPEVATDLNNLAQLLQATNRLAEAEPLKRRALAIDEKSFGPDHPNVAIPLNNLAQLLQATNRLPEAEPLMRRAVSILLDVSRKTGHESPNLRLVLGNYAALLLAMGKTEAETEATIRALTQPPG
jgi:tetratricopeptide (TPR) repeat protein